FFATLVGNYRETCSRIMNVTFSSFCDTSEREMELIRFNQLYGFTKFIDLLDTVFFVLRKKQSQVTLLHFYHHFSVCFLIIFLKFLKNNHFLLKNIPSYPSSLGLAFALVSSFSLSFSLFYSL